MSGIWEYNRGLNLECIRLMKQLKDLEESTHEEMKDLDKEILELKSNVSNLRNANNRLNNELKEKLYSRVKKFEENQELLKDKEILDLKSQLGKMNNTRNANNRLIAENSRLIVENSELREKQDFSNRERYWSSKFKDLQTELFNKENELDRIKEVLRGV